jgi:putative endonuclease
MITVYVLRSQKTGYRYIGQTADITRRLTEHNAGLTRSTKFQVPFSIEYTEEYPDRRSATQRERFLKTGQGRAWLDSIGK